MYTIRLLFVLLLTVTFSSSLWAQPPAETCGAGDSLGGADMMPQSLVGTADTDDFTMTGTSCNELGLDNVTCFVPTTDCTVVAECSDSSPPFEVVEGLQFSVSAFQGACTTSPVSCLDSSQGTGVSGQISVALTGGTQYCFVCERGNSGATAIDLSTAGSCGALPVELQSLEVE
jgi:hypothetical protein